MKFAFYILETKPPAWVETARREYETKIGGFIGFEIKTLKSPTADRGLADVKRRLEAEKLLAEIDDRDLLVLFDEKGKAWKSSEDFAAALGRARESGKARVVFVIGGPYGFDDRVRRRAQNQWSLSGLTMNHWIAQLMALEQIYRGLTIVKGVPYHNR